MLVADEVQTGFGRTGRFFAIEHSGVEPDLICVAKSIASGLPLSGVLGRAEIMDAPARGGVGGTYVGNPVAHGGGARRARRDRRGGSRRARRVVGETIRARMLAWQERWPAVGDVRGLGAMLAIELVADRETQAPSPELARAREAAALERGLLLITCGVNGNCIRVLVPLVVTDSELDEALGVWEEALEAVLG